MSTRKHICQKYNGGSPSEFHLPDGNKKTCKIKEVTGFLLAAVFLFAKME